ncbi:hypothetical protein Q7C36_005364 [Tachysurus vachellii]|uniref:Uncharacterized protein n=1 Tax=Tachysurus vachellii TaxID=175792 RepID=A0AA88NDP1_TACVA|nr:hypothetical protein Q7C36_005364 [Tachysurus vachellii]
MEYHPSTSAQLFRVEVGLCLCQALALGREYGLWLILLERSSDGSQNSLVANTFDGDPLAVDCESRLQTADCSPTEHVVLPSKPETGGRRGKKSQEGAERMCVVVFGSTPPPYVLEQGYTSALAGFGSLSR